MNMDIQQEKKRIHNKIYHKQIDNGLGNPKDDYIFLKYKHTIDRIKTPIKRKEYISNFTSLPDNVFEGY